MFHTYYEIFHYIPIFGKHKSTKLTPKVQMRSFTCWSFSDHNFLKLGVGNATLPGGVRKRQASHPMVSMEDRLLEGIWIVGKSHNLFMDCCFGTSCFEMRYEEPWGWSHHFVIFCPDVAVVGLVPTFAGGRSAQMCRFMPVTSPQNQVWWLGTSHLKTYPLLSKVFLHQKGEPWKKQIATLVQWSADSGNMVCL